MVRIFYTVNRSGNGKLTFKEYCNSPSSRFCHALSAEEHTASGQCFCCLCVFRTHGFDGWFSLMIYDNVGRSICPAFPVGGGAWMLPPRSKPITIFSRPEPATLPPLDVGQFCPNIPSWPGLTTPLLGWCAHCNVPGFWFLGDQWFLSSFVVNHSQCFANHSSLYQLNASPNNGSFLGH